MVAIIALLLSLLLPVLNRAKALARLAVCSASTRALTQGVALHAEDHFSHMPLTGHLWVASSTPAGLDDPGEVKHIYYDDTGQRRPAPPMAALGAYLGHRPPLDSRENLEAFLTGAETTRPFACAAQENTPPGLMLSGQWPPYWTSPLGYSSYSLNEASCGSGYLGKMDKVRLPAATMSITDAVPRTVTPPYPIMSFFGPDMWFATTYYYMATQFDYSRHTGKMNVAFVDCHVQTVDMLSQQEMSQVLVGSGLQ